MAKVALNKSALNKEKRNLTTYDRYLPALELKRQQLMAERKKARQALSEIERKIKDLQAYVEKHLPMLACEDLDVRHLVHVTDVKVTEENIVGCRVPQILEVAVEKTAYNFLSRPHWVDSLVETLAQMVRLKLEFQVGCRREELLRAAAKTVSQRVNLFSKVLIPGTRENIRKIGIYLSDQDRAAVMNAKLSKQKVLAQQSGAKVAS